MIDPGQGAEALLQQDRLLAKRPQGPAAIGEDAPADLDAFGHDPRSGLGVRRRVLLHPPPVPPPPSDSASTTAALGPHVALDRRDGVGPADSLIRWKMPANSKRQSILLGRLKAFRKGLGVVHRLLDRNPPRRHGVDDAHDVAVVGPTVEPTSSIGGPFQICPAASVGTSRWMQGQSGSCCGWADASAQADASISNPARPAAHPAFDDIVLGWYCFLLIDGPFGALPTIAAAQRTGGFRRRDLRYQRRRRPCRSG